MSKEFPIGISDVTHFGFKANGVQYVMKEFELIQREPLKRYINDKFTDADIGYMGVCDNCVLDKDSNYIEGIPVYSLCNVLASSLCDVSKSVNGRSQLQFVKKE